MIRFSGRLLLLSLSSVVACGPNNEEGASEQVAEKVAELGKDISSTIIPSSNFQSETAIASMGSVLAVAMNSGDTAHGTANVSKCLNYSGIGLSYKSDTTWRGVHPPVPSGAGIAMLRGDPGISYIDLAQTYRVYVSSLATSVTAWNAIPKRSDGCANNSDVGNSAPDRVCVLSVQVPKDGSAAFNEFGLCVSPQGGGAHVDGSDVYASPSTGLVYLATWDDATAKVDAYRLSTSFSNLPNPFAGKTVTGHPIFVRNGQRPGLIAPTDRPTQTFYYTELDETARTWTTPARVAGPYNWNDEIQTKDGRSIRDRGYSGTWMTGLQTAPVLLFAYRKPLSGGFTRLQGVLCTTTAGLACVEKSGWITNASANAFSPAVAVTHVPRPPAPILVTPWMSFWDDSAFGDGTVALRWAKLDSPSNSMTLVDPPTKPSEKPCLFQGYWGDYDGMTVDADGTTSAAMVRPFTDSTGSTCTANGDPMHVSTARVNAQ